MNQNHVIDGWLAQLRFDSRRGRASLARRATIVSQAAWGSRGPGLSSAAGAASTAAAAAAS